MSLSRYVWWFTLVGICLSLWVHTLVDPQGWQQRHRLKVDLQALAHQNQQLEQQIDQLRKQLKALQNRSEVQEHTARDELGWVHPDDLVIYLDPQH